MFLAKNLASQLLKKYAVEARPSNIRQIIEQGLFPKQYAAYIDNSILQCVVCSRRAGKTTGILEELLVVAETETREGDFLYLSLNHKHAKSIAYEPFKRRLVKLGFKEKIHYLKNDSELTITFLHNNNRVFFSGAESKTVINNFRGYKFHRVRIDEAGTFKYHILQEIVEEVIFPSLGDLNGNLQLCGTPPPVPGTYFEEAFRDKKAWSTHYWTFKDNPYVAEGQAQMLDLLMKKKGWTPDNPKLLREYFGQFIYDLSRMLFKFSYEKNVVTELPFNENDHSEKCIGVDFGYRDSMAFVILKEFGGKVYMIECFKKNELTPTEFAKEVKDALKRHNITYGKTAADPGGLGRAIIEDYRKHHSLNLQDATKTGKGMAIEICNELFVSERFLIFHTCYEAIKEFMETEKDPRKPDLPLDGQEDHCIDSTLYGLRLTDVFNYKDAVVLSSEEKMFDDVIDYDRQRLQKKNDIVAYDEIGSQGDFDSWL